MKFLLLTYFTDEKTEAQKFHTRLLKVIRRAMEPMLDSRWSLSSETTLYLQAKWVGRWCWYRPWPLHSACELAPRDWEHLYSLITQKGKRFEEDAQSWAICEGATHYRWTGKSAQRQADKGHRKPFYGNPTYSGDRVSFLAGAEVLSLLCF